ncbi:MAG: hypothetical protein WAU67_13700 [Terracidiphilus sp.]
MWWLFMVLIVGYIGFSAYGRGKRAGIWSWSKFGITLGFAACVCSLVTAPILLIDMKSPYFLPVYIAIWVVALAGIVWFATYAKRWTKKTGTQESGTPGARG